MAGCFQTGKQSLADPFLEYSLESLILKKMSPKSVSFKVRMDYYQYFSLLYCTDHRNSPSNSYIMTELLSL